jgi:hypothetical protein
MLTVRLTGGSFRPGSVLGSPDQVAIIIFHREFVAPPRLDGRPAFLARTGRHLGLLQTNWTVGDLRQANARRGPPGWPPVRAVSRRTG